VGRRSTGRRRRSRAPTVGRAPSRP
jgi:hypothetical protein